MELQMTNLSCHCRTISAKDKAVAKLAFEQVHLLDRNMSKEDVFTVLQQFEDKASELKHQLCKICMCTSLCMKLVEHKGLLMCSLCRSRKAYKCDQSLTLPVWIDNDGITQYGLPEELECLREAEKLLIAQVSAYVPLHHLRKGQLGCRGHTCCFTQVRQNLLLMM
jgi:hypothetical protein